VLEFRTAGRAIFEAAELFCRNDDHLVASMHGDALRSLTSYLTDEFTEARLGILQKPMKSQAADA
jgi:hypothetical protein